MANRDTTIAGWMLDDGRIRLDLAPDSQEIAAVRNALAHRAPLIPWAAAEHAIGEKIAEALQVDAGELLIGTWLRSALLVKYLDSSRYPADKTILAHLAEHTISIKLEPKIAIYAGEIHVTDVQVKANVSVTVKGFVLTIKAGRVLQMTTGTCQAKGQVSVAGAVITERKSRVVQLPGVIPFGEGRRIEARAT